MSKIRCLVLLFAFVLLTCSATSQTLQSAEEKAALLSRALQHDVADWRVKIGEATDGQDPKLDDSGWKKHTGAAFVWGTQPLAWLRTRVTIPADIAGISTAGSKVTFRCGVDDDGTIYVNGAKATDFHWDQGRVVLTDSAQPGQTFDIAIRNTNGPGEGRLLMAGLEFSVLDPIREATSAYLSAYGFSRELLNSASETDRPKLEPCLIKAMQTIDLDSLRAGKIETYLASLNSAATQLKPVSEIARGITASLVGHAHIDLAWLWTYPETVQVCKNTFSTACDLMDQYPLVFAQSQAHAYEEVKRSFPDLYARIKERVKRGQWDVSTAMMWSEGDTNLSSGEGLVRSMLLANRFVKKEFGVEPTVGWLPDNFGHTWTLPQIFAKSGVKSICFMRCGIGKPVFWWESPDGSRILAYNFPDYNGGIDGNQIARQALDFSRQTGIPNYMKPFGVGDHGGGPTREMLDAALTLQKRPDYPKVQFSSALDYINGLSKHSSKLPVHTTELGYIFEGCYTTHADVKRGNRMSENSLFSAEAFCTIAAAFKSRYPAAELQSSWKKTCFNEFHDILCGSGIHPIYDDSNRDHKQIATQAKSIQDTALAAIVSKINTRGRGIPIVVLNPLAWTRTDSVTLGTPFPGENTGVRVSDASGKSYPVNVTGSTVSFTARNVPATGYKVFWANRTKSPAAAAVRSTGTTIENQYYKATIDPKLGVITGIYDKLNKRSVMAPEQRSALMQILTESDRGMSAWNIGHIQGTEDITTGGTIAQADSGPARASIVINNGYNKSKFAQEVVLYDGVPRIDIKLRADWHEKWAGQPTPFLKAAFSADLKDPKATFDIPFGSIERPRDGREVAAQKWIDMSDGTYGLSLLNDCKYGFDVKDNTMRISLIRSPHDPDPNPDEGRHEATYSLYPHAGDWRTAATPRRAYELNNPLVAVIPPASPGEALPLALSRSGLATVSKRGEPRSQLTPSKSFLSVSAPNVIVTALKKAEDDDSLILRFYETDGKPCNARITTALPVRSYIECDLMERPIGKKQPITNGAFTVPVGKCEIKTYKLMH